MAPAGARERDARARCPFLIFHKYVRGTVFFTRSENSTHAPLAVIRRHLAISYLKLRDGGPRVARTTSPTRTAWSLPMVATIC